MKKCLICGKILPERYPSGGKISKTAKYCSTACINKSRAKEQQFCIVCSKPIPSHNSKYCSQKCYGLSNRLPMPTGICVICGKQFTHSSRTAIRKTCSKKCFKKLRSQVNSKENNPRYLGPVVKVCPYCGKEFSHSRTEANRIYCSKFCQIWGSAEKRRNPNHWRNKGDKKRDKGQNWGQQSAFARKRDNYTCQNCGLAESQLGQKLDVHHIIPYVSFGGDWKTANRLENLISYCRSCHVKIELSEDS